LKKIPPSLTGFVGLSYHGSRIVVYRPSSHVIPALACAEAWDLWLRPIIVIRLIMNTRHYISGRGKVVCFLNPHSIHPPANLLDYEQCILKYVGIPSHRG
jgi:hypothetical protein